MPKRPRPPEEAPEADERPSTPRFLTLDDLAARWAVTVAQVKVLVRDERVPFLALKTSPSGPSRICWKFVRFQEADILEWESRRKKVGQPVSEIKPVRVFVERPMLKRSPPPRGK